MCAAESGEKTAGTQADRDVDEGAASSGRTLAPGAHVGAVHPDGPALVELFARVDPWGLVESGAPRDEYTSEVCDLLDHPHPDAHDVLAVFSRWGATTGKAPAPVRFGTFPGISREDAHRIADGIAQVRAARRAPDAS